MIAGRTISYSRLTALLRAVHLGKASKAEHHNNDDYRATRLACIKQHRATTTNPVAGFTALLLDEITLPRLGVSAIALVLPTVN